MRVDAFSYLSVLLSIILGLAIAQLLQGIGQLLQARGRVRWHWPAAAWMAALLLIYVQSWWAMFGMRNIQSWTFGAFSVVLLQTILEYLLAALLTPLSFGGEGAIDLRAHYFAQARAFFVTLLLTLLASLSKDLVLSGSLTGGVNLAFHLVLIAMCAACAIWMSEWLHRLVAATAIPLFVAYIATLFTRLR